MGKVYLVGAGPGDMGLITVKGLGKLQECDAVVYDRLASDEFLSCVRADCEKIYVGKQAGSHYKKQEEINRILIECAKRHFVTVRLKGGDSFVFGRGGEEIEALEREGIPYEVIPGVTSAVAVPECAGIPVTHRGISRSFHVITGHTKDSVWCPDYDYQTLAKLEGTLIFLMGLSSLGDIARELINAGREETTPAAVIANGTTGKQQEVRGTLAKIAEKAEEAAIPSPAVIVIGKTADRKYLDTKRTSSKAGIVATAALQKKLKRGFEGLGMETVPLCKMEIVETEQMGRLQEELRHIETYQWILFTSQNGVTLFFEELKRSGIDIRKLGTVRFAVLGSGTGERLGQYGIQADFIPSRYTVEVLAQEFAKQAEKGEKVLILRAVQGSEALTEIFSRCQIAFLDLRIYDVVGRLTESIALINSLDYIVFVSASGVQAFFGQLLEKGMSVPRGIKTVCIGRVTEQRLAECYGQADIVASVNDVDGILKAVQEYEAANEVR